MFAQNKIIIGPDYTIDPNLTDLGNPKGNYFEFTMRLSDSKIFREMMLRLIPIRRCAKSAKFLVYIPASYKDGTKAPILVTLDGPARFNWVT